MLNKLKLVFAQTKTLYYLLVLLYDPRCGKPRRNAYGVGVVLYHMANRMYAAMHGSRSAEVHLLGLLLFACRLHRKLQKLLNTVVLCGGYGQHRDAETARKLLDIHGTVVSKKLIHHIERKHHRLAHFGKLKRKIEVSLDVRCVGDVQYGVGRIVDYKIAGNDLLAGVRTYGVYARQIDDGAVLTPLRLARLMLNRNAGEVADMLI